MTIENFSELLDAALKGVPKSLSVWADYAHKQAFTRKELAQLSEVLPSLLANNHPQRSNALTLLALRILYDNKPTSCESAMFHLKNAVELKNPTAMHELGKLYLKKDNFDEAIRLFEMAITSGNTDAMIWRAKMHMAAQGGGKNYTTAINLLKDACRLGNADAMTDLATLYLDPNGVEINYPAAMGLLKIAMAKGCKRANDMLDKAMTESRLEKANSITSQKDSTNNVNPDAGVQNPDLSATKHPVDSKDILKKPHPDAIISSTIIGPQEAKNSDHPTDSRREIPSAPLADSQKVAPSVSAADLQKVAPSAPAADSQKVAPSVPAADSQKAIPSVLHVTNNGEARKTYQVIETSKILTEQEIARLNAFKREPTIANLFNKIEAMKIYGEKLATQPNSQKSTVVKSLANTLEKNLNDFLLNPTHIKHTEKSVQEFKATFQGLIDNKDNYALMQNHREIWKPIVANILIALTGIGFLAIMANVAIEAVQHGKQMSFNRALFFATTNSEQHANKILDASAAANLSGSI